MVKIVIPKILLDIPRSERKVNNSTPQTIFGTVYNYTDAHISHMQKYAPKLFDYFIYQSEMCPTSGRMHLQYCGLSKVKHTVNYYQDNFFVNDCTVSTCHSPQASLLYCSKKDSHEGGLRYKYNVTHFDVKYKNRTHPFEWDLTNSKDERTVYLNKMDNSHKARSKGQGSRSDLSDLMNFVEGCKSYSHALTLAAQLKDYNMLKDLDKFESLVVKYFNHRPKVHKSWPHKQQYDWQKKIIRIVESKPNDRTINFVVDFKGKSGKSTLSDYLIQNYNAFSAFGKEAEVYYLYSGETVILCDSPRDRNDYINYSTLEKLKDGTITSTKYQPLKKYRDDPAHIIVFMNQWPDIKALSRDRYNIYYIDPDTKDLEAVKYLNINHKGNKKYYDASQVDLDDEDDEEEINYDIDLTNNDVMMLDSNDKMILDLASNDKIILKQKEQYDIWYKNNVLRMD